MHTRPARDPVQTRLKILKQAESLLLKYLDTCERLELFQNEDLQAWQSMLKDGEHGTHGKMRAVTRDQKIERFRWVLKFLKERLFFFVVSIYRDVTDAHTWYSPKPVPIVLLTAYPVGILVNCCLNERSFLCD